MQDDELKQKLGNLDAPKPSDGARERALNLAMQAFAEQQQKKSQGSHKSARPIQEAAYGLQHWIGSFSMKKAYVVAGSFASLAVVLGITTTYYSDMIAIRDYPAKNIVTGDHYNPQLIEPEASADMKIGDNERVDVGTVIATPQASNLAAPQAPPAELSTRENASLSVTTPEYVAKAKQESKADYDSLGGMKKSRERVEGLTSVAPSSIAPYQDYNQPQQYVGNDKFENFTANPVKLVSQEPVSTFSIDADTASYSFVRRTLNGGALPPKDAVRVEEMVNYFSYNYPLPEAKDQPFKPTVTVYATPWNKDTKLVHIGIKGYDILPATKPRANIVFLVDVSGSMSPQDRLPLAKNAFRMLVDQLNPDDTIGIVTYAGNSGTALEPTKVSDKQKILAAIDGLGAGGSTAGAAGIEQAYALAQAHFDKEGVNRVILATDGDFNVGVTDPNQLQTLIEKKRESGIFLSILGFGQGNYNDALMQKLAQHGNGTASYIDTLNEARKVLVEEAGSTLFTIAKDVKIQMEFNPSQVSEYRLVGYESRLLNREDFNNDKIDAGEVGSGHAVTAIYEITPVGAKPQSDPLRYGQESAKPVVKQDGQFSGEYGFLKMRYKLPDASESKLLTLSIDKTREFGVCPEGVKCNLAPLPDDVRFATAVAAFGQMLKGDPHVKTMSYDDIITLADGARGKDAFGTRAEFVNLVRLAKSLQGGQVQPARPVE